MIALGNNSAIIEERNILTPMSFTANEIAERVGGDVVGDGSIELGGFAQADAAMPGDLTFAENKEFFGLAEQSQASAILAPDKFTSETKTIIRVKDARIAFAQVLPLFFPEKQFAPGIHRAPLSQRAPKWPTPLPSAQTALSVKVPPSANKRCSRPTAL